MITLQRIEALEREAKALRKLLKKEGPVTDRIKTFEDACDELGIAAELPKVDMLPKKHQKSIIAFYKLTTIIEAINEGWVPDWSDVGQGKWFNYFCVEADKDTPGGSGFSNSGSNYSYFNNSHVGSRLCLKDEQKAKYVREKFEDLYKDYFLI